MKGVTFFVFFTLLFSSCRTNHSLQNSNEKSSIIDFKITEAISQMRDLGIVSFEGVKYPWGGGPGNIGVGPSLSFDHVPQWFAQSYPNFHRGERASYVLPWIVIGFGEDNKMPATQVEMRNWELFFRQNNVWKKVQSSSFPSDGFYNILTSNLTNGENWDNKTPINVIQNSLFHGWSNFVKVPEDKIEAVAASVEMRKVGSNATKAIVVANLGVDPYPATQKLDGLPAPAIMLCAPVLIDTEWSFISAVTFTDAGNQEPGGGITTESFRQNPPKWTNLPNLRTN